MNAEVDRDSRARAVPRDKRAAMPDTAKKRQIQKADPETVTVLAKARRDLARAQLNCPSSLRDHRAQGRGAQ